MSVAKETDSSLRAMLPKRVWAYLQLMRPANIVTAWADIIAGVAAAGVIQSNLPAEGMFDLLSFQIAPTSLTGLVWLLVATTGLYGGGVVFNDVFDAELDQQERPERPIPSGRASQTGAAIFGSVLFLIGLVAATQVSIASVVLAGFITAVALLYNAWGKHQAILGPLNMGLCRGSNLLLGMSVIPSMMPERWFLALIPIIYIAAITTISRGEVYGGTRKAGAIAIALLGVTFGSLLTLGLLPGYHLLLALPFWVLLASQVIPPFVRVTYTPEPKLIQQAVRAGVLSLILLDATFTAGFAGFVSGLLVLSLLPFSMALAHRFAVT
jgi:4-hydroxybenzoate polyprenyltransferase